MHIVRTLYYIASAISPCFFVWALIYLSRLDQTTAGWVAGAVMLYPLALSALLVVLGIPLLIHARVKRLALWPVGAALLVAASPWGWFAYRVVIMSLAPETN